MTKKDIMKKAECSQECTLQKQISPGCGKDCECEAKIRMLKKNNNSLAKALSDEKIEANHWFTEVVALKGELHELREKLLKVPDNNMNMVNSLMEKEKKIKEYYEAIDKDFHSALDSIVKAVEKISKMKDLVGCFESFTQSSSQQSSNIFTSMPDRRVPLRSKGSITSLRRRAVPPMVGGHVLHPVMVPIPRLKIDLIDAENNQPSVHEDSGLDLTTIGEQSSPENNEVIEEQQSLDVEEGHQPQNDVIAIPDDNMLESQSHSDTTHLETRHDEDTSRGYSLRSVTKSPREPQVTPPGRNNRRRQSQSRSAGSVSKRGRRSSFGISNSHSARSSEPLTNGKEAHPSKLDDPLEGPSWLLDVGGSRRRFCRPRSKIKRKKNVVKTGDLSASESSDEDEDGSLAISQNYRRGGFLGFRSRKEVPKATTACKDSPSLSLDQSCLDSPASMSANLETLGALDERKSKRFVRNPNVKSQSLESENVEVLCLQQDEQVNFGALPNTEIIVVGESCSPKKMVAEVNLDIDCNKSIPSLEFVDESNHLEVVREVNDLTCNIVTSMDLTWPVCSSAIQDDQATSTERNMNGLQDRLESNQHKKKFFKTKGVEIVEKIPAKAQRTPFDISMISEPEDRLSPFSSTRKTEKENLPPPSVECSNECARVCGVSVVLEDVLRQPGYSETPRKIVKSPEKESQSANCMPSSTRRKLRSVTRSLQSSVIDCTKDSQETRRSKRRKMKESYSLSNAVDVIVESPTDLESKTPRKGVSSPSDENKGSGRQTALSSDTLGNTSLEECFVVVHRTPILENITCPQKNLQNYFSDLPNLLQQSFENNGNPQGQEEVKFASDASPDAAKSSCISTCINTEGYTSHIQKKVRYKEDTETDKGSDKPEENFILLQDVKSEEQMQQDHIEREGMYEENIYFGNWGDKPEDFCDMGQIHPDHSGKEKECEEDIHLGIETDKTEDDCILIKDLNDGQQIQLSERRHQELLASNRHGSISNAEETPSRDSSRKRRAAARVSSFKEFDLKGKIRRGKNNAVIRAGKNRSRKISK